MIKRIIFVGLFALGSAARAQPAPSNAVPFQDNSFFLEEAYNQDDHVVQHIFGLRRYSGGNALEGSFTQEWPMGGQRHQFSYDVPVVKTEDAPGGTGLGDLSLNYRLQLIGGSDTRLASSPRLSVKLPTGRGARGKGSYGIEASLPVSYVISNSFVTHTNLGVLHTPRARTVGGRERDAEYKIAQSLIYTPHSQLHLMLETVWTGGDEYSFLISPGIRAALNFKSRLQIVPGFAVPIETRGDKAKSVFYYLSFEHPFGQK